jgi:hypothetical protein
VETFVITIPIILLFIAGAWLLVKHRDWQFRQMAYGLVVGLLCAGTAWAADLSKAVESTAADAGSAISTAFADLTDGQGPQKPRGRP